MADSLDIAEVARLTGLTSRALRFYEARGLVDPLRRIEGVSDAQVMGEAGRRYEMTQVKEGNKLAQAGSGITARPNSNNCTA